MSQDLHERVSEILNDAETASGSMITDENGESDETDLLETADRASDLLDSAEPDALLEAVGLDELPDGSEPDSIPAAIARGDPEQVEELQRLLRLANLADGDEDGALEGAAGAIRQSIADSEERDEDEAAAEDETPAEESGETEGEDDTDEESESDGSVVRDAIESVTADETDESESENGGARAAVESVAEGVSEASGLDDAFGGDDDDGAETDADDESDGDLGEQLRSAMESTVSDVGDDLGGLQERLQSASASSVGGETESDDEAEAEAEADEDDGLIDSGLGSDQDRGTASGSGTRHSTMAPPPSERADMKGTARHSTMPDKH
ncbi:hypothetical protein GS429_02975 [Natronorubrum sp. JWXQ-INN-674]|uniref:Uncharacterized protein n=1 Tax=Natronorubrum halalkaliphilum TaxID=2691917 RepID=A0A6B0VIW4_9EURY|nr:hypothetical protein [Natronorubrum halalkaliphilum]MXV61037.1 hypothetical protein [Natronorubrum halalkaliphilum]